MSDSISSPETGPKIVFKTPEQLQKDAFSVNLHQVKEWKKTFEIPRQAIDDPSAFLREIGELRNDPDALEKSPYAHYDQYVKALRAVRKSQAFYREHDDKGQIIVAEKVGGVEEHLGRAGFSPHLAKDILAQKLNRVAAWSDEVPLFTDQEIRRGLQSEQDFMDVLNLGLLRRPGSVYKIVKSLEVIFTGDELKSLIEKAGAQANGFIDHFKEVKHLFTPEEQRIHIDAQLNSIKNPFDALDLFKIPEAAKLYTPSEIHQLVLTGLKDGRVLDSETLKFYMNGGVISSDETRQVVLHSIRNLGELMRVREIILMFPNTEDVAAVKTAVFETYTTKAMADDCRGIFTVRDLFSEDEKLQIITSVTDRDKSVSTLHLTESFEDFITPEKYAPILREVLATPDIVLDGVAVENVLEAEGLTEDEKEQFCEKLISSGRASLVLDREGRGLWGFKDEERRNRVAKKVFAKCDQRKVAENLRLNWGGGWGDIVNDQSLTEIMSGARFSECGSWIQQISNYGRRLRNSNPDYLAGFLEAQKEANATGLLTKLPEVIEYLPPEKRAEYIQDLIRANPVAALIVATYSGEDPSVQNVFTKAGVSITPEQILQLAQNDTDRLAFAPKTMRDFMNQYKPELPPEEQKSLLLETVQVYRAIGFIKSMGLEVEFKQVQSSGDLSVAAEKELVSTFYCLSLLKDRHPEVLTGPDSLGNNLTEAKSVLFNHLAKLSGIERELGEEEINRFFGVMETPVPFMMYLLQFEHSPTHKVLLKDIFEAIVTGRFSEWKFGPPTGENLDELKKMNLLPESLTLDQYLKWRSDGQTTLFESLATDTDTTAKAVGGYLRNNLQHLHIESTLEVLINKYPGQDVLEGVHSEMITVGRRFGEVNKELTDMRRAGSEESEKKSGLEQERAELEITRNELLRVRKILRLAGLKPNEVASGFLLEGKDGKQRGDSINKVIGELKDSAGEDDKFVYDGVTNLLASLRASSDEKQNLLCTDSSDPKVWIEIGEKPVASCQSYDHGGYNECLTAYTDPNSKILVLRNEKGSIIARSVFRLLTTSTGAPALHIERVYSSSTSKGVLRSMFTRAFQKAEEMGLPLLISEQSQDEDGGEKGYVLADGSTADRVEYSLVSRASRSPKVYVDSAGGAVNGGRFRMNNLLEIKKAA